MATEFSVPRSSCLPLQSLGVGGVAWLPPENYKGHFPPGGSALCLFRKKMAARLLSLCGNWDTSNKAAQNAYPATGDNRIILNRLNQIPAAAPLLPESLFGGHFLFKKQPHRFLRGWQWLFGVRPFLVQTTGRRPRENKTNKGKRDSCQVFREAQRAEKNSRDYNGQWDGCSPLLPNYGF